MANKTFQIELSKTPSSMSSSLKIALIATDTICFNVQTRCAFLAKCIYLVCTILAPNSYYPPKLHPIFYAIGTEYGD
jgi:hypothetical protein